MICKACGAENGDGYKFCSKCGAPLASAGNTAPVHNTNSNNYGGGYVNQSVQRTYGTFAPAQRGDKAFLWGDVSTVFGFVCSIVGFFWFWLTLCPVGLAASIYGFYRKRMQKLAAAGIVISAISILIKIGYILSVNSLLPLWLIGGAF